MSREICLLRSSLVGDSANEMNFVSGSGNAELYNAI